MYRPRLTTLLPPSPNFSTALPTVQTPARPARVAREIADQRLSEFALGKEVYELFVPYLDGTIWFVPTIDLAAPLMREGVNRGRIWTASELCDVDALGQRRPADIPTIGRIKAAFGAEVVEVTEGNAGQSIAGSSDGSRQSGCRCCSGSRFWRSIYNVVICAVCHPPAAPDLVSGWLDVGEDHQ